MMNNRFFTRDCKGCQYWERGACNMVSNCSSFEDLYSHGRFYSTMVIRKMCTLVGPLNKQLWGGYFVDIDGTIVGPVKGNGWDVIKTVEKDDAIVGILVPFE